jgi:hypothetical protein
MIVEVCVKSHTSLFFYKNIVKYIKSKIYL